MAFITDDFLLGSRTGRRLYHRFAADQPILDYHCHLPPRDLARDRRFENLWEIWLEGDHYKWRAMRANGVDERYCTGDADPYDKFVAWARTVPYTLRNPLYHWTHLELLRYFDIDDRLSEENARDVWDRASERLARPELSAHGILRKFRVSCLCTTDDPADSLEWHEQIARSSLDTAVLPCFRPDAALQTRDPATFNRWVDRLEASAGLSISRLPDLLNALRIRHDDFHAHGCRLSDHGLDRCFVDDCSESEAARIFDRIRGGAVLDPADSEKFASHLMLFFGRLDAERGWTTQLHLGAMRDVHTRLVRQLGPNTGFDSIGDWRHAQPLATYLDRLARENALPKTIVYNTNPADNYVFTALIGSFQEGPTAGKIQFGSGWWFLDQKEAIEWQLNALSSTGLLSRFVGMVTDSRSFMSYPRHEYFRRILCNLVGADVDRGELPDDDELIGRMIRGICYSNAAGYLGLSTTQKSELQEK